MTLTELAHAKAKAAEIFAPFVVMAQRQFIRHILSRKARTAAAFANHPVAT